MVKRIERFTGFSRVCRPDREDPDKGESDSDYPKHVRT
jgi:hypothetical protein